MAYHDENLKVWLYVKAFSLMLKYFALALLLMVSGFVLGCLDYSKSEYALLQSQELNSRTNLVTHTEFHTVRGYDLVVFVPDGISRNMWIMLNPKYSPYFKQMPPGEFSIDKDVYMEIEKSGFVHNAVLIELKSRVVNVETDLQGAETNPERKQP